MCLSSTAVPVKPHSCFDKKAMDYRQLQIMRPITIFPLHTFNLSVAQEITVRPVTTSFLQTANICRLLKCKNSIPEAYNSGFS